MKDFLRWPMNVTYYGCKSSKCIHIYSLPWPSSKDDQRRLPTFRGGINLPVSSDVKRSAYMKQGVIVPAIKLPQVNTKFRYADQILFSASIDIQLPICIHKLILSRTTRKYLVIEKNKKYC